MDRREFIEKAGLACLAGIAGTSIITATGCKAATPTLTNSTHEGRRVKILQADWPANTDFIIVRHPSDEHPIYIHKDGDNYIALHMKCTHRGCNLNAESNQLTCPCHGSKFHADGKVKKGHAKKPLVGYKPTADTETIYVEIM